MRRLSSTLFAKPLIRWPSVSVILRRGTVSTALEFEAKVLSQRRGGDSKEAPSTQLPHRQTPPAKLSQGSRHQGRASRDSIERTLLSKPGPDVCRVTATAGYHRPPLKRRVVSHLEPKRRGTSGEREDLASGLGRAGSRTTGATRRYRFDCESGWSCRV